MKQYGIIGNPLVHSFSAEYFRQKFLSEGVDAQYTAYTLRSISEFRPLCRSVNFCGLNVTTPYKESIIPYLDSIDPIAKEIGAVNVIKFEGDKKVGYNTDWLGFYSTRPDLIDIPPMALVLGTGGASKAVQYALKQFHIDYSVVSRSGNLTYCQLTREMIEHHRLIINCTPLGMYPLVNAAPPIPYNYLSPVHLLYDLIYNPAETLFLKKGKAAGATTHNGYKMLVNQAEAAWQVWDQ